MKTIGLLGGMSWESSAEYYRMINEEVKQRLGGLHSAQCILYSVDFAEIEEYQSSGDWDSAANVLIEASKGLEKAGADFLVICTNTMHKLAPQIEENIKIPLLHIADATAKTIKEQGVDTIGLLGTRYTMEQDFYKQKLVHNGITVKIPDEMSREKIHQVIYEELCVGMINPESKESYREIINHLVQKGAQGIILGCTEIGLLIKPEDSPVPLFDTARIHAIEVVNFALEESKG